MSSPTIASCSLDSLSHPITALADRPALSAEALKAYFDGSPLQLMDAHNRLIEAIGGTGGAENIGFSATSGVDASTVQEAIEAVQQQLADLALSSVPDGSITKEKLAEALQQQLDTLTQLQTTVSALETASAGIRPSGAQFPFMVLALSDNISDTMTEELAAAALGINYTDYVYDLGEQLCWLCKWNSGTLPSDAFRAKQTYDDILNDSETLNEIASLPVVVTLIGLSVTAYRMYSVALNDT